MRFSVPMSTVYDRENILTCKNIEFAWILRLKSWPEADVSSLWFYLNCDPNPNPNPNPIHPICMDYIIPQDTTSWAGWRTELNLMEVRNKTLCGMLLYENNQQQGGGGELLSYCYCWYHIDLPMITSFNGIFCPYSETTKLLGTQVTRNLHTSVREAKRRNVKIFHTLETTWHQPEVYIPRIMCLYTFSFFVPLSSTYKHWQSESVHQ